MSFESNPQEETWNPPMNADDYQKAALRTMADQAVIHVRNFRHEMGSRLTQLDNAARGMAGDVGEVNSCVQKCLEYGQQLDLVNLKEELGDVLWRIIQACDAVGFTLEEVMQANIAKLAKRYPDKYSDFLAAEENRDREGERQVIAEPDFETVNLINKALTVGYEIKNGYLLHPEYKNKASIWKSVRYGFNQVSLPHGLQEDVTRRLAQKSQTPVEQNGQGFAESKEEADVPIRKTMYGDKPNV